MKEGLKEKLEKIRKVLDVQKVSSISSDQKYVQEYYRVNKIPYTLFHTATDRIYMGISRDGVYKEDDLLGIARIVSKYISDKNAKAVLELATGRGANSFYLAQQFPQTEFFGVDISNAQLSLAYQKAKKVHNYSPAFGDYHDLRRFKDDTFDIVFVVEALCYSTQKEKVLEEVHRVLKKGGLFIIFDGYLNKDWGSLTDDQKLATDLVEKGMALTDFEPYTSFRVKTASCFTVENEEDLSKFVIPTMERFEKLGQRFFKRPRLARALTAVFPAAVINNAATGYLMPTVMREGVYCYMLTVLAK